MLYYLFHGVDDPAAPRDQGLEMEMSYIVQIGGNTYDVREYIKAAGGKWQATTKTWAMDDLAWAGLVESKPNLMRGCMIVGGVIGGDASAKLASVSTAARDADRPFFAAPRKISPVGPCRKCGSYCYGDCEAN